jgi:hypothetical protein
MANVHFLSALCVRNNKNCSYRNASRISSISKSLFMSLLAKKKESERKIQQTLANDKRVGEKNYKQII